MRATPTLLNRCAAHVKKAAQQDVMGLAQVVLGYTAGRNLDCYDLRIWPFEGEYVELHRGILLTSSRAGRQRCTLLCLSTRV